MTQKIQKVALLTLILLGAASLKAELVTEATLGSGYQGNLFYDSNSTGDTYASAGMVLKYYPAASTQVTGSIGYNAFNEQKDMSNLTGDLSVTVIPSPASSPISLTLAGNLTTRQFGTLYEPYDQVGAAVGTSLGVRLAPWAHLLSSVSYVGTEYANSDYGSNRGFDLTANLHLAVLGANALALGLDYSRREYDQAALTPHGDGYSLDAASENSEPFAAAEFKLRYSRPIGMRTGLSLSAGRRLMLLDGDYVVPGYTIDNLSPWANLWDGFSLSGKVKHFFPQQLMAELSLAYFDKDFVDVIEFSETTDESYRQSSRADQEIILGLSLARPITLSGGSLLTPTVRAGYRDNRSSISLFSYDDVWASLSLTVAL